ncbi:MAG: DUF169 domain-containing protein [Candidatus Hermodarchaeota archaeon]
MNKFETLRSVLKLNSNPIGVKLIYDYHEDTVVDSIFTEANKKNKYCDFVKKASEGEFLKIQKGDFSCNTADMALGFQNFNNLELNMRLDIMGLKYILLFPINKYLVEDYDSIILILNPHNCMNIIQAYVRLYKKPLKITCGIISGVCSEVTAYVIKRNEVNFSFLCTESRKNGVYSDCEILCGIPAKKIDDLIESLI